MTRRRGSNTYRMENGVAAAYVATNLTYDSLLSEIARAHPDREAVVSSTGTFTYGALDRLANRIGRWLHSLGIAPGNRVALVLPNSREWVALCFGISKAQAVMVPLNPVYTDSELSHVLADAEVHTVICRPELGERIEKLKASVPALVTVVPVADISALENQAGEYSDAPLSGRQSWDCLHSILYTSGTTGKPKGAALTHRARVVNSMSNRLAYGIGPGSRFSCGIPLFHSGGLTLAMTNTIAAGGTLILPDDASAASTRAAIEKFGANYLIAVPTIISRWLDDPAFVADFAPADIDLVHGGSSMPAALAEKLSEQLPGWRCRDGYGLTEVGQLTVLADDDYQYLRDGATGRALPGVEIEIIDADGNICAPGEVGAVATRGPHVFEGYLGHDSVDPDGWFRTGDLGYVDERGLLFLVGRTKELIISGGLNVYAPEVENAVSFHPAVEHVAVIGLPDDEWGEIVCAFVQVREGQTVTADELIELSGRSLAPYKKPRRIEFVESFPLTAAGKIRKAELRNILSTAD